MADGQQKCICRGSNADCSFCYGTGYASGQPGLPSSPAPYRPPAKRKSKKTRPTPQRRSGSFRDAFLWHGTVGQNSRQVKTVLFAIEQLKDINRFAIGDYQGAEKIFRAALHMERRHFVSLLRLLCGLIPSTQVDDMTTKRAKNYAARLNSCLRDGGSEALFDAADVQLLARAWKRKADRPEDPVSSRKAVATRAAPVSPTQRQSSANAQGTRASISLQPRHALVCAFGNLLPEQIVELKRRLAVGNYRLVYVTGSKKAIRAIQQESGLDSVVPVMNEANAAALRGSRSVEVIDLDAT